MSELRSDLTLESLCESVRKLNESRPEPWFDEVRGHQATLIAYYHAHRKLFETRQRAIIPVPRAGDVLAGLRVVTDQTMSVGLLMFRGRVGHVEYIGIMDLESNTFSCSKVDLQRFWGVG